MLIIKNIHIQVLSTDLVTLDLLPYLSKDLVDLSCA